MKGRLWWEREVAEAGRCAGPFGRRIITEIYCGGVRTLGDREDVGSVRTLRDREDVGSVGTLGDREASETFLFLLEEAVQVLLGGHEFGVEGDRWEKDIFGFFS